LIELSYAEFILRNEGLRPAIAEELGIIEVIQTGDKKVPQFQYDKISFEVAI
jgi:hypothetical protein